MLFLPIFIFSSFIVLINAKLNINCTEKGFRSTLCESYMRTSINNYISDGFYNSMNIPVVNNTNPIKVGGIVYFSNLGTINEIDGNFYDI